jgi:hypothetical protein
MSEPFAPSHFTEVLVDPSLCHRTKEYPGFAVAT